MATKNIFFNFTLHGQNTKQSISQTIYSSRTMPISIFIASIFWYISHHRLHGLATAINAARPHLGITRESPVVIKRGTSMRYPSIRHCIIHKFRKLLHIEFKRIFFILNKILMGCSRTALKGNRCPIAWNYLVFHSQFSKSTQISRFHADCSRYTDKRPFNFAGGFRDNQCMYFS